MANLESRVEKLERAIGQADHCVKVYFCNEGADAAVARAKAGIAPDYAGKTIRVEFVEPPTREADHAKP